MEGRGFMRCAPLSSLAVRLPDLTVLYLPAAAKKFGAEESAVHDDNGAADQPSSSSGGCCAVM